MDIFHQFSSPRMPAEIQVLIWKHFVDLTPPRTLPLKLRSRAYDPKGRDATLELPTEHPEWPTPRVYAYYTPGPVPAALHVCHESRLAAMKRWTLAFGCEKITRDWDDLDEIRELCGEGKVYGDEDNEVEEDTRGTIWIDFERDILEFVDMQENDEREEERTEEERQITITEFSECVDERERMMIKNIQMSWEGFLSVRYFENTPEFRSMRVSVRYRKRAQALVETFGGLKRFVVGYPDLEDSGVECWKQGLKWPGARLLVLLVSIIERQNGLRVEYSALK